MPLGTPARFLVPTVCVLFFVAALGRADEADDEFAVAAGLHARGQWKLAADELQQFIKKYPKYPQLSEAVYLLGEALQHTEKLEPAGAQFREYLQREPAGKLAASAAFRAAETDYFLKQFDRAKAGLQQFAAKYPADSFNASALAYLGNIALAQQDPATAERHFREGLTRFPDGAMQDDCRYGLARALEQQGKREESERYYLGLAGKTASRLSAESQFRLGALEYAKGDYAAAVRRLEAFESTFAQSPLQPLARMGRSWSLIKLNRPDEAAAILQQLVADPQHGMEARYWLGLAEKGQKNWRAAAKTLLEAVALDPKHKLASAMRFHAGDALVRAEDFAAAREQFNQVVASSGDAESVEQALRGRIQVALRTKDYAELDRDAADFQKRFPKSLLKDDVQRMAAQSLVDRRQFAPAAAILEPLVAAAGKEDPRLEDRYLLALAYEGLERRQDGLKALEPVLPAAGGQLKADALLTRASLLVALKQYPEAIAPLEAYLAGQPTGDGAVKGLGQLAICYARTKQLDKAKTRFTELIEKYPTHDLLVPTSEQVADAAFEAGDSEWSGRLFAWLSSAGRSADRETRGLSGLGWSHFKAGRFQEAADAFDQVLKRKPGAAMAAEAALVRGRALAELNHPEAALAMYDLVTGQYPQSVQMPDALWAAARLRNGLKQYKEAAALYERLAKEYPQFPEIDEVLYRWAWALSDLDQKDQSTAMFERLRKEHPASKLWADAGFRLAQRAFEGKDYAKARALVATVLARNDANAEIRSNTAYLRGQLGIAEQTWDEARQAFEALLKEFPQNLLRPQAEFGIAETDFRQAHYPEAEQRFQRLTQESHWPDRSWPALVRLRLAQTAVHQQKWKEAFDIAGKIAKEYPDFEEQYEVDYLLGRCLANQAEFDAAREAYGRAVRSKTGAKTETAAKAQLMIAESFFHQKNYEAALREYLRVEILYAFPAEQAGALMQAGKCHELLGEWKQAAETYARLIKTYPATTFVKEAGERFRAAQARAANQRG